MIPYYFVMPSNFGSGSLNANMESLFELMRQNDALLENNRILNEEILKIQKEKM